MRQTLTQRRPGVAEEGAVGREREEEGGEAEGGDGVVAVEADVGGEGLFVIPFPLRVGLEEGVGKGRVARSDESR